MATSTVTIPFVSKSTEDLLMWRDVKKSGMVFGGATAVFLFFAFLKTPLITLTFYTVGFLITAVTLWARFGKTIGKPMPELPLYLSQGISEVDYKAYGDRVKPSVDKALSMAHGIATVKNLTTNLKIIGGAFVAGKVFAYLSPISLAYLCVFLAFVAPKVYEKYKKEIDDGLVVAKEHGMKGMEVAKGEVNKVIDKVPALKNVMANMTGKKTE